MNPANQLFKCILIGAFTIMVLNLNGFNQQKNYCLGYPSGAIPEYEHPNFLATSDSAPLDSVKIAYQIYLIINRGNSRYNGYALRFTKDGVLMASSETKYTGCRWELVPTGGHNEYLFINRGNSIYNGYALRLTKEGVLMATQDSYYSGCKWELVSTGNNQYLIVNRGDSDYNGFALRLDSDGVLQATQDSYFSGCKWELEAQ